VLISALPGVTVRHFYDGEHEHATRVLNEPVYIVHFGADDRASLEKIVSAAAGANCYVLIQTQNPRWSGPENPFYYTLFVVHSNLDLMEHFLGRYSRESCSEPPDC
jgi:hypothetical protein